MPTARKVSLGYWSFIGVSLVLIGAGIYAAAVVPSWPERAGVGSKRIHARTGAAVDVLSALSAHPIILLVRFADGSTAFVIESDLRPLPESP